MTSRKEAFFDKGSTPIETTDVNREWCAKRTATGWRLAFLDRGDEHWTYSGLFPSLESAVAEVPGGTVVTSE